MKRALISLVPVSIAVLTVTILQGCSTHSDQLKDIRSAYYSGNLPVADAKVDRAIRKNDREADVWKLERAMILLTDGKPKEAEALLREVRDRFDALEGRDAGEMLKSMLSDDQQLAYSGEDYEKVMIRFMLGLCNIMHDGSDATAYALQVNQKQQEIIEKYQPAGKKTDKDAPNLKANYKFVPAGAYLHAALCESTHKNFDDAARSLELVAKWQPSLDTIQSDLQRVKHGKHSQPGHGVVYVFTMLGKGPYKIEADEPVSTVSLLIADRIFSALGRQSVPPTFASIKVPRVIRDMSYQGGVQVMIDGQNRGQTRTLTDVTQMAIDQCDATVPEVVARAVVRRVVKKGVVYGVKEATGTKKDGLASVGLDVAGVVWEATESADTRCWGLLPDKIQVLRVELPAGQHTLQLQANQATPPITITVEDGRNNYVLANFPDGRLAGKIVTNTQK